MIHLLIRQTYPAKHNKLKTTSKNDSEEKKHSRISVKKKKED